MGRDLKGNEIGKGLTQRKDGYYSAKFTTREGVRKERYFEELKKAKQWLADAKYEDAHNTLVVNENMTVNEWFAAWIGERSKVVRANTVRNYKERYERNIKPIMGRMRINDVKPIHCQRVLNEMKEDGYAGSTIKQTLLTMTTMFWSAFEQDIIRKTPVTKTAVKMPVEVRKSIDFFTVDEERRFIEHAKDYAYYPQFRLVLEIGLRTSELIGLTWSCVDLDNREIHIDKCLEYRYSRGAWHWGPPKTKHGYRTIKLTDKAYDILKDLYDNRIDNPLTPEEFKDVVFLNRTGYPTKNSTYDAALTKRCEAAGVKRLSMHDLRHTMATRYCENSTNYKYLSQMLGHSSIKITLDTYVHNTEKSACTETEHFSGYMNDLFGDAD